MHYRSNLIVSIILKDIWFEYLFIIQSNGQCMSEVLSIQLFHKKLFCRAATPQADHRVWGPKWCFPSGPGHWLQTWCFFPFPGTVLVHRFCPPPWDKLLLQPSCTSSIAMTAVFFSPHCVWGYWALSIVGRMNLFAATDYSFWWGNKVPLPISSTASVERGL